MMPTIKQLAKSKINEFNLIIAPALVGGLAAIGIIVPLPVVIAGYALVNFVLRTWFTDKAVSEK